MMLTQRDRDLMYTLLEVKILTIDQISQLFFPSPKTCRNRLLLLRRNGWLEEERPRPYAMPTFSVLKLGKSALKYFEYPYSNKSLTVYLEHRLELNDLYVHLRSSGILQELGLNWQDGSIFDIRFQDTHFKPDARMFGSSKEMIYLEYDRGTKNLPIVQENIAKYFAWFDDKQLRPKIAPKIRLIYVTPKNSRALAIQRQFEMLCLKQNRILSECFRFDSLTTKVFLEQSKVILGSVATRE